MKYPRNKHPKLSREIKNTKSYKLVRGKSIDKSLIKVKICKKCESEFIPDSIHKSTYCNDCWKKKVI